MWLETRALTTRALQCAWLLLAICALPASASSGVLTGSLGRWLDSAAAPELGALLAKHPRFQGETVRLVSMHDGRPVEIHSQLHQAVQDHLTQRLLQYPGVRIAWRETGSVCGAPQTVPYLLGIDIDYQSTNRHSLNIAMVDVADSIWVSGVNFTWNGRLNSAEKVALNRQVQLPPKGTVDSPLPVDNASAVAELLQRNLQCALPEGLDGPVFMQPAASAQLRAISGQLQGDLSLAAVAAITRTKRDANWLLELSANPIGTQIQEVVLTLTHQEDETTQQVASVFVAGRTSSEPARTTTDINRVARLPTLLSPLALHSGATGGICESHSRDPHECVEITFDLQTPAYLFVLSTRDRNLRSNGCSSNVKQAQAGSRRYRLRLTGNGDPTTAEAGLYAIAVRDQRVARALARHIREAPGTCKRHSTRGLEAWLRQLDELLAAHPDTYEWRAMHLVSGPAGVQQI